MSILLPETPAIPGTEHINTPAQAKKWLRDHVIIKKTDLRRVGKLCKQYGIYTELKALDIDIYPLGQSKKGSR